MPSVFRNSCVASLERVIAQGISAMTDQPKKATGDYKVGYCRPPIHSQFKPGHSAPRERGQSRKQYATLALGALRLPWKGQSQIGDRVVSITALATVVLVLTLVLMPSLNSLEALMQAAFGRDEAAKSAPVQSDHAAVAAKNETPALEEPVKAAAAGAGATSVPADVAPGSRFAIGDRLTISFYERIEVEGDRVAAERAARGKARRSFQPRTDLTGEYAVQEDGTINLPLLGAFPVADRSLKEVQADLARSFEALGGGFVTILAVERPAVYVVGPVKASGAYKYAAGMTVLHAVALAGGFDRPVIDAWQKIESVREGAKLQGSHQRLMRLLARAAVLRAERDGKAPAVPTRLKELAGEKDALAILVEEAALRNTTAAASRARDSALLAALDNAKAELEILQDRVAPIDEHIKLRAARVASLQDLKQRGVAPQPLVLQAHGDLTNVQERRQEALIAIALSKQRLARAEQERTKHQVDTRIGLNRELAATEQEIALAEKAASASESVLGAMPQVASANGVALSFEIMRRSSQGLTALAVTSTSELQPGDLVHIRTGGEGQR
jgi:protein involved in polysaccharide export with SLBB domain